MKKITLSLLLSGFNSQAQDLTINDGLPEIEVYDRFGNIYTAEDIEIKPGARANACDGYQ